uniref:Uncharacterized protein n=1 Tax=Oryza rufipogon TaxID=4529 RepID=A0A0E0QXB9_ORYRU
MTPGVILSLFSKAPKNSDSRSAKPGSQCTSCRCEAALPVMVVLSASDFCFKNCNLHKASRVLMIPVLYQLLQGIFANRAKYFRIQIWFSSSSSQKNMNAAVHAGRISSKDAAARRQTIRGGGGASEEEKRSLRVWSDVLAGGGGAKYSAWRGWMDRAVVKSSAQMDGWVDTVAFSYTE